MRNRPGRFTNLPPHIPSPRSNSCTLRAIHIHHNEYGETFSSLIVSNTLRGELFREASPAGSTQSYTRSPAFASAKCSFAWPCDFAGHFPTWLDGSNSRTQVLQGWRIGEGIAFGIR